MYEKIFLSYVNKSFKDDIAQLLKFLDEIDSVLIPLQKTQHDKEIPYLSEITLNSLLRRVALHIVDFNQLGLQKSDIKKNAAKDKTGYPVDEMEIAFEALYGYRDNYCIKVVENATGWYESACSIYNPYIKIVTNEDDLKNYYLNKGRINCIVCHQLYIKNVIDQIIDGVPYTEILGLNELLEVTQRHLTGVAIIEEGKIRMKERWRNPYTEQYPSAFLPGPDIKYPYKHVFNNYIRAIVGHSIIKFLSENDRSKIKKCIGCDKIIIAKRVTRKYCNDACRLRHHSKLRVASGEAAKYKRELYGWKEKGK